MRESEGENCTKLVEELIKKNEQQTASSSIMKFVEPKCAGKAAHELMLLFWLMQSGLPFSAVDNTLYRQAHDHYATTSRSTLRKLVPFAVEIVSAKIRQVDLVGVRSFAVTTDCWTDAILRPYMALTYHFIDHLWNLRSLTLDVVHAPGPHTAEALAAMVNEHVSKWMPASSVMVAVVADGAAAARSAARQLVGEDGLWCLAHQLQLAMKDFCSKVDVMPQIEIVRNVVTHVRGSAARTAALCKAQKAKQALKLILDVPTRFSSSYDICWCDSACWFPPCARFLWKLNFPVRMIFVVVVKFARF